MASPDCYVSIVSESAIVPDTNPSSLAYTPLFVSDLPMLSIHYIQKGCLFSGPLNNPTSDDVISHLKLSLSKTLSLFPPLAGRLAAHPSTNHLSISCSQSSPGALFLHARAPSITLNHLLHSPYIPSVVQHFFPLNDTINHDGHSSPLAAVQLTELADAVFIGCSVNHIIVDGTSFWNFFKTFSDIARTGVPDPSIAPSFPTDTDGDDAFFHRYVVPPGFPGCRPAVKSSGPPVLERVFHFSCQAMLALKKRANDSRELTAVNSGTTTADEISSFQSMCAQLWRSVARAQRLPFDKTTAFLMPVNCRNRVKPPMDPLRFGSVIQVIRTTALAGEVVSREIGWSGNLLHRGVVAHDDRKVRERVGTVVGGLPGGLTTWKSDDSGVVVGSSPRFPVYEVDFGWGRPMAVRSGKANKFDGKCTLFPGREGGGSVDVEVVLAPEAMVALEMDPEFMHYAS